MIHVAPHPRHQGEAAAEQAVREVLAEVAFVAKQFPDQPLSEVRHRHGGACKDFCVKVWFHCDLLCEAEPVAEQDSELCLGSGPLALWHRPSSSSLRHRARPNTTVWLPPRRMGSAPDCARSCAACC